MSEKLSDGPKFALQARNGDVPCLLLAEDSTAARILTAALLRRMGCEVDEAENGEEALKAAHLKAYHTIILDIEMPVMDGITAARAIRALPDDKNKTPLIALSAFLADSGEARHWLKLFDLTHPKPASREGLRQAVSAMLKLELNSQFKPSAEISDPLLLIDHHALLQMQAQFTIADWSLLMQQAIDEMRDSLRGIHAAMQSADRPTIRRLSHRMKGLARSFAAPCLADKAEKLENEADFSRELQSGIHALQDCLEETTGQLLAMRAA